MAKVKPTIYYDGSLGYLELHAMRAPVGHYKAAYNEDDTLYGLDVVAAIKDFETTHNVKIYLLGRSGRHICIADTPRNRYRYAKLQKAAVKATLDMWRAMREPGASEWPAEAPKGGE